MEVGGMGRYFRGWKWKRVGWVGKEFKQSVEYRNGRGFILPVMIIINQYLLLRLSYYLFIIKYTYYIDMISRAVRWRYYFSTHTNNLELLMAKFAETKTPFFKVQSDQIQILKDPMDFYLRLYNLSQSSHKRIGLSSLYLGTGTLERYLLEKTIGALKTYPTLQIRMLFDYHRSKRVEQGESGIQMMQHALMYTPERLRVGYLTQNYSPLLKLFSKGISEVIGVHHIKLYVFDNTTIITGANLSHSYFTRRQDRCIVINDCEQLSSYFYDLINGLVNGSYLKLQGDNKEYGKEGDLGQYYKLWRFGNRKVAIEDETSQEQQMRFDPQDLLKKKVLIENKGQKDIELASLVGEIRESIRNKLVGANDEQQIYRSLIELAKVNRENKEIMEVGEAVYLFPTLQINSVKQNIERETITKILQYNVQAGNQIYISSGYMNLPNFIIDILLKTKSRIPIITSTPKANSFFQGGRFKRYIPIFYRVYEHLLLTRAEKENSPLQILEYQNNDWTFHTKGIWIQEKNTQNMLTVVGSSNFNMRSYERDTECQLYIYSTSQELNQRFREEWGDLEGKGKRVGKDIDKDREMMLGGVVKFMAKVFNRFL